MSKKHLLRLAGLVMDRPLLITPQKADVIASVLAGRIGLDLHQEEVSGVEQDASAFRGKRTEKGSGFYRVEDGVAIVSIVGSLANRGSWVGADSGIVTYEGIQAQLDRAMDDDEVSGILLDLETPGGEASGCMELGQYIREKSSIKPIHAFVNSMACSAGYAIAAGCKHITSIPSGYSGSVGVVFMHTDASGAAKKAGLKRTFIYAGTHKVDGHPYGPLPDSVRQSFQLEIDEVYDGFVAHIAQCRGMSDEVVRATEARIFKGHKALELGLIDEVGTIDDALEKLSTKAVSLTAQQKGLSMSKTGEQAGNSGDQVQMTQAELDAKLASAKEEGKQEGLKEGAAAETERVNSILGLEEAKGRTGAALAAIQNGLTVDQAQGMIATSAKDASAQIEDENGLAAAGAAAYEEERKKAQASAPDLGNGAGAGKELSAGERLLSRAQNMYRSNK